jgi:hypothetical protein
MLLDRVELDAVTAIERLAGMQAQYTPSPYVGLWSRLRGFQRAELEQDLVEGRVVKATLMRGTLHLVSAREYPVFRAGVPDPMEIYVPSIRMLETTRRSSSGTCRRTRQLRWG